MRVIVPGHAYALADFESEIGEQVLQFIYKQKQFAQTEDEKIVPTPVLKTVADGTTNEEVLAVLIDRMNWLQQVGPCLENVIVLGKLQECLYWLNKRTADRMARGVEGTAQE